MENVRSSDVNISYRLVKLSEYSDSDSVKFNIVNVIVSLMEVAKMLIVSKDSIGYVSLTITLDSRDHVWNSVILTVVFIYAEKDSVA